VRVLLDTHTLIWWATDDPKLSRDARSVLSSFDTEVFVSAASAWEVSTKVRIGKLPGAEMFAAEFPSRVGRLGFRELAISVEHGQRAGLLPGAHKDPFDRMLIAQAQAENMPIVSNERVWGSDGKNICNVAVSCQSMNSAPPPGLAYSTGCRQPACSNEYRGLFSSERIDRGGGHLRYRGVVHIRQGGWFHGHDN
jgi:PIN domain nuclease of toxin-antitoxin system